jgi:hypothetical protein
MQEEQAILHYLSGKNNSTRLVIRVRGQWKVLDAD